MMGDGSAAYTKALGLELDLTARGMGVRCQRFSMLVDDGVVKSLNVEAPGKFEVSGARDDAEAARLNSDAACRTAPAGAVLFRCDETPAQRPRDQRSLARMPSSWSRLEYGDDDTAGAVTRRFNAHARAERIGQLVFQARQVGQRAGDRVDAPAGRRTAGAARATRRAR